MDAVAALAARWVLAAAFAASAAAKFRRPGAFARSLAAFGVPAAPLAARLLPPVEAAVAASLVAFPDRAGPPLAAIGLLAFLTGGVIAHLASGRAAPCPCFRPEGGRPTSAATVVRNGVLLAVAVIGTGSTDGADPGATAVAVAVAVPLAVLLLRRFG